jgi:RNA polymerase sigma-70 factor (ECF subfamily)
MSREALVTLEAIVARLASAPADEEGWRALYRQIWPFVFAVTYRRLRGARALAEDASQEVFIRLARTQPFDRLREAEAFRRYVWRVADNVARTYARRQASHQAAEVSTADPDASASQGVMHPTDVMGNLEAEALLHQLMKHLGEGDRDLLRLVLEGRSLSDIAGTMGLSYGAAAVRLHRLRERVRKSLFSNESSPAVGGE